MFGINLQMLHDTEACLSGVEWFEEQYAARLAGGRKIDVEEVLYDIGQNKNLSINNYIGWLVENLYHYHDEFKKLMSKMEYIMVYSRRKKTELCLHMLY